MITEFQFDVGEQIFGDDARALVASLFDGQQPGLISILMNYHSDKARQSVTDFPTIHFAGRRSGFALLGFGDNARMVLDDVAPMLQSKLGVRFNRVVPASRRELAADVSMRPYALQYRVPRMVVQKKHRHLTALKDPKTGAPFLERLFMNSIQRQSEAVGLELPAGLEAKFLGAEGEFAARRKHGESIAALGLKGAVFSLNAKLGGIWSVGFLLSKGYGHFNADLQLGTRQGSL